MRPSPCGRLDHGGDRGAARVAALDGLQLAVEVVGVQDGERHGCGRGRGRGGRPADARSAATTSSRIGRERLTGAPPRRGHAGRSGPSSPWTSTQGTIGTLVGLGEMPGTAERQWDMPRSAPWVAGAQHAVHPAAPESAG